MVEIYRTEKESFSMSDEDYQKEIETIKDVYNRSPFKDVLNERKFFHDVLIAVAKYRWTPEYALMVLYFSSETELDVQEMAENDNKGYVYLIHSGHGVKIGKSKVPVKRITDLQTQMPFRFTEIENTLVRNYSETELYLHKVFSEKRLNGEWFNLDKKDIETARGILNDRNIFFTEVSA